MLTLTESTMARLRIRELAEQRGMNMSQLQRDARLTMSLMRRYWYNTADGKEQGPPLEGVRFDALDALAASLGVEPGELIIPTHKPTS